MMVFVIGKMQLDALAVMMIELLITQPIISGDVGKMLSSTLAVQKCTSSEYPLKVALNR